MVERRGRLRLPVNGDDMSVPSAFHLRCPKCAEIVLRFEDARRRVGGEAISLYCRKHRLLSADAE